jgi:hypothetical protein
MAKKKPVQKYIGGTTHMSFEIPIELRNAVKAKIAAQGKTVREVMLDLLEDYVKDKN